MGSSDRHVGWGPNHVWNGSSPNVHARPSASPNDIFACSSPNDIHAAKGSNVHSAIDFGCFNGCISTGHDYASGDHANDNYANHNHTDHDHADQNDDSECEDVHEEEIQEEDHQKEERMLLMKLWRF